LNEAARALGGVAGNPKLELSNGNRH